MGEKVAIVLDSLFVGNANMLPENSYNGTLVLIDAKRTVHAFNKRTLLVKKADGFPGMWYYDNWEDMSEDWKQSLSQRDKKLINEIIDVYDLPYQPFILEKE